MSTEKTQNTHINLAFVGISRRAESVDRATLVQTFVDVGPLFAVLSTNDHQVVFGRRGTGKTHALLYVAEQSKQKNNFSIYVDLRFIGSSGGLYGDVSLPLPQRASRLLLDVLGSLHEAFLAAAIEGEADLSKVGPALDKLGDSMIDVEVVGETSVETKAARGQERKSNTEVGLEVSGKPSARLSVADGATTNEHEEATMVRKGVERCRVHFGSVSSALRDLVRAVSPSRILLVLDEWAAVPLDLQPYLADLVRRAFFPVPGITVKIAAIEQRSQFRLDDGPDYVGIEIGADASADVDLDDYMVFDNNGDRAIEFFRQLLFSHYHSEKVENKPEYTSSTEFIAAAFTQVNAFEDFVRSTEGVPRDAFNILSVAAQRGMNDRISIPTIRKAARTWYQRDKEAAIRSNPEAYRLLHWIIDEVIAHRKARAFLLTANSRHTIIDALFDARLLHIIKKGVSGQEQAGIRYDAYKLDYGCYVDLLTTKSAPNGSFFLQADDPEETNSDIAVPSDDYRAIRRAVLNLADFENDIEKVAKAPASPPFFP